MVKLEEYRFGNYNFECWYWETSRAWGHECHLVQGSELGASRIRYYNRTWEKYTYQSVMFEALESYAREQERRFLERYKMEQCDYDYEKYEAYRFKKGEKQKALEKWHEGEQYKELMWLKDCIGEGKEVKKEK